jgi:hypothetical protein
LSPGGGCGDPGHTPNMFDDSGEHRPHGRFAGGWIARHAGLRGIAWEAWRVLFSCPGVWPTIG